MDAAPSLHPTDQTLSSYGLGKLDDRSAEAVNEHLDGMQRLPETGRRDVGRQLPRTGPRRSEAFGPSRRLASRKPAGRRATSGEYLDIVLRRLTPAGPGRPPRLRDQAGTRPGRHGRGLPGPQQADGPRRGAQGDGAAPHGTTPGCSNASSARSGRSPGSGTRTSSRPTTPPGSARASSSRWSTSRVSTCPRLVKTKGPMPVAHACLFIHQAALGLQHAHEEGLVHRDIKPHNLMLSRKGDKATVKILDSR